MFITDFDIQDVLLLFGLAAAGIAIIIFFLLTIHNTLKLVEPPNRSMQPAYVWLLLIPVFGLLWSFVIVNAVSKSCNAQLEEWGVFYERKTTERLGMGWATCQLLSVIYGLFSIISIVLFISYWIKVNEAKKQLQYSKLLNENKDDHSIL